MRLRSRPRRNEPPHGSGRRDRSLFAVPVALVSAALVSAGLLTACTTSSPPAGGSATGPAAPGASATAPAPAPAPSTGAAPGTSAAPGPAPGSGGGPCATIDLAAATALLGATPKQLAAPTAASTDDEDVVKVTKIEGCSYTGTDPSLGYDVNHFDGLGPVTAFISAAKAQMGARPGVTPFDVGLGDQSVGFTVPVGPKTMARVEVAKGQATIAVVTTGTDPAKAKAVAIEATRRLLAIAR